MNSANAEPYEEALVTGKPVFLYLHTSYCGYCKKFDPIYEKLVQSYKNCQFVKVSAETLYGNSLMRSFKANYIPYVVLVDSKKQIMTTVQPECLLDYVCVEKELRHFMK